MLIQIDTLYLHEMVYRMLRDLDDGEYINNTGSCRGMLNAEQTAALDDFIRRIENEAKGN